MAANFNIDEVFQMVHPIEKYFFCIFLNFKRNGHGRFELKYHTAIKVATVIAVSSIIVTVALCVYESKWLEAREVLAVSSLGFLSVVRSGNVLFKRHQLGWIANELDALFPHSADLQQRMGVPRLVHELNARFRWLYRYMSVSFVCFVCAPIGIFLVTHERGAPMKEVYFLLPFWIPFGVKRIIGAYPLIYVYEFVVTLMATIFYLFWDRIYTIFLSMLRMHFEFLADELKALRAEETYDAEKAHDFLAHWRELLVYHQTVNRIGRQFNKTFYVTIIGINTIAAATICFNLNVVINQHDLSSLLKFVLPCCFTIWFSYEICKQGTHIEEASGVVREALYNHNWYEGSLAHRQDMMMWMQRINVNFRLTGHQLNDINMEHFRIIMLLAYHMLTVLLTLQ